MPAWDLPGTVVRPLHLNGMTTWARRSSLPRMCTSLASLRAGLVAAVALGSTAARADDVLLQSPQGHLRIVLSLDGSRLTWHAALEGTSLIERSPLGIVVDGVDLGQGVTLGEAVRYEIDESFPWNGGHSQARA